MPERDDPLAALPADARERFDAFTAALERINVGDMTLYSIPDAETDIDRAREAAHGVARERGLEAPLEAARQEVLAFVAESYREASAGLGYMGSSPTIGFGPDDDRLRVMQSVADAVTAVVLGDALEGGDRAELLGGWGSLLPGADAAASPAWRAPRRAASGLRPRSPLRGGTSLA